MKNIKIALKLTISYVIVIAMAITVGVVGILGMHNINKADDRLYNENVLAISAIGGILETLQCQRILLRDYALNSGNRAKAEEIQGKLVEFENEMDSYFASYESTIRDASTQTEYYGAKNLYQGTFAPFKKAVKEASLISIQAGRDKIYDPDIVPAINAMVTDFNKSMENNVNWSENTVNANSALYSRMTVVEIVVLLLSIIVAIFFALYISGMITKPIGSLTAFMKKAGSTGDITLEARDLETIQRFALIKDDIGQCIAGCASFVKRVTEISEKLEMIAEGDLTAEISLLSDADVMGSSLQKMIIRLNDMFSEINISTDQVSSGAKQIADGAQTLAQGSTEQAASIQQLSASISQIAEKTKTNAVKAGEAAALADKILGNAEKGSKHMDEMLDAVKEINQSSQGISKVIKVIDDIAFQTNILALNAAVEAARAGQHGKGFAVVAEEVRNLAAKSAEAANDTGAMIQDSMEKAGMGARIASETAASLTEIVSGINDSSKLIAEIAKSSEDQSYEISQINTGIDQVAQVVHHNSATAEESAASSEEMSSQSFMLQELISQFKLKGAGVNKRLPQANLRRKSIELPGDPGNMSKKYDDDPGDKYLPSRY